MSSPIVRFVVTAVEEKGGLQYISGRSLAGEYLPKVLHLEAHGMSGSPPLGSIGLAMPMGSNRDQMVCIGLESPGKRPTGLGAGHAVLYDADGNQIYIGNSKITITAPDVEIHGNLKVIGGGVTNDGVNIGKTHVHGGVVAGGDDTATPH
jgi:phage gp45-like